MLIPSMRTGISTHPKTTRLSPRSTTMRSVVRRGCRPKKISRTPGNKRLLPDRIGRQQFRHVTRHRDVDRPVSGIAARVYRKAFVIADACELGCVVRHGWSAAEPALLIVLDIDRVQADRREGRAHRSDRKRR